MSGVRIKYQTIEITPRLDVHVRSLRDLQQYGGEDDGSQAMGVSSAQWPIFGVVWDASVQLAIAMSTFDFGSRRIMEMGCGLGLASLVLNSRGADITATDRHPLAREMLEFNVALNGGPAIPFVRADWTELQSELSRFDLIIGSDVLFERGHAESVSAFIGRHANPTCETLLADPGRKQTGRYDRCMQALGFTRHDFEHPAENNRSPKGLQMLSHRREG